MNEQEEKQNNLQTVSNELIKKPQETSHSSDSLLSDAIALLLKMLWIAAFFAAVLLFVAGITTQSGNSMAPSFRDSDVVLFYRLAQEFETGECVVFHGENGRVRVGRVIALPGDVVDITEGGLMINGYYQSEAYTSGETLPTEDCASFPVTIQSGELFILFDHRDQSGDSRILGAIPEKKILGRVMIVIRQRDF